MKEHKGRYIIFDGIDYTGKTTQAKLLKSAIEKKGLETVLIREPGGTEISEKVRDLLLDTKSKMNNITELFLYEAARSEIIEKEIIPAVKKGKIVIADRSFYSSLAYQGNLPGIKVSDVEKLNNLAIHGIKPDLAFFLDMPYEKAHDRFSSVKTKDRIEKRATEYFNKVRNSFLEIARQDQEKIIVLDANQPVKDIQNKVRYHLNERFRLELEKYK